MAYEIRTIGGLEAQPAGAAPAVPMTTKLAIAGVVAGALLYMSPEYQAWERKLSTVQRIGLGVGVAGLFLGLMQVAMQKDRERRMLTFERDQRTPEGTT